MRRFGSIWILSMLLLVGQAQTTIQLIGRNTGSKILHDGNTIRTFGFAQEFGENPGVPGPTLEFTEGDSIILDFWNISQGAPHTIHLHGLDVNQENDGVPHLSFEVHHNEHGYYRFRAPHAGTYLYHCHVVSSIHVQAGMYGLIVIHPSDTNVAWTGGPEVHFSHHLMFSEIDTIWHHDSVLLHEYDTNMSHHFVPIPKYKPQHFLVNGLSEDQLNDEVVITGQANSSIYLHLANIGFMANLIEFPSALNAQIISSDGRPLPSPEWSNSLEIYPGERYGVLLLPNTELVDEISVDYLNLNTNEVENTQSFEVNIQGYYGIQNIGLSNAAIAPNPTSGKTFLSVPSYLHGSQAEINVYNVSGQRVSRNILEISTASPLDLSLLPSGIYQVEIKTKSGADVVSVVKQ